MNFDIIVALDNDSLIGVRVYGEDDLPWPRLKGDMEFFREKTTSVPKDYRNAIIVGYNTWQTLPAIYKNNKSRLNIVVTNRSEDDNISYGEKGEFFSNTFENAYNFACKTEKINKIYVIGGARIYEAALKHPMLHSIYVTHIYNNYNNNVDLKVFFPINNNIFMPLCLSGTLEQIFSSGVKLDNSSDIFYNIKQYRVSNRENLISNINKDYKIKCIKTVSDEVYDESQFLTLVKKIMKDGITKNTRNSVTKSIFGYQLSYDLTKGYPISTLKRSYPKSIFEELMWMIRGQTSNHILQKLGVHIWDGNSSKEFIEARSLPYKEGDIGAGYGFQMRHYGAEYIDCHTDYTGQGVDQLANCIDLINNDPHSRRIIIDLWNPKDLDKMCLPPCHMVYNFSVDLYTDIKNDDVENKKRGRLNCHLFQRSWDVFLGWNSTTAALLTYLLANHCNLDAGILVHSISDVHLYQEHIDSSAVNKLIEREPRKPPRLIIKRKRENIEDYTYDDIILKDYYPSPSIKVEMKA